MYNITFYNQKLYFQILLCLTARPARIAIV